MFASYLEHSSYFCGVNTRARLRKHVFLCVMKLWNRIKNESKQCPKMVFTENGVRNESRSMIGILEIILDRLDIKVRFTWGPVPGREE